MSYNQPYLGTKHPTFIDTTKMDIPQPSGIYIGKVKAIDTNTRSGRLQVFIPQFGGANPDLPSSWKLVSYASPFMGSTSSRLGEYTQPKANQNKFSDSTQSYGFYMSPPDIGTEVLCCFVPGSQEGYWFACVNSSITRNMTPAIGSVELSYISPESISESGVGPYLLPGKFYPVAETVESADVYGKAGFLPNLKKPLHIPQTIRLIVQGLDSDNVRGAISSSSQRDPVSSVFGFSTPGRPFGSQDPATDPNIAQKLVSGEFNPATYVVTTRVGGHSFVMDDGDLFGKDNLVRLKTAMGHQIMLNDTEGFIYVANSNGTAWIELTKEGDILVYGAKDFALRTQGNIMMHSDNNISFFAGRNINMQAVGSVKMAGQLVQASAETALNLYGKQAQLRSGSGLSLVAQQSMGIRAGGSIAVNGAAIALNGGGGGGAEINPPSRINLYQLPDAKVVSPGIWFAQQNSLISTNYKVPTHEPYIRGDATAIFQNQAQTVSALPKDVLGDPINPPADITVVGPAQADRENLTGAASAGIFIAQPEPIDSMGNLDKNQVRALMAQIGYSESEGSYQTQNANGYQGKYLLGSKDLQDLGYVKAGTPQTAEALSNPNNWTGKDGISSSDAFRENGTIQEKAMYNYTKNNYARLQKNGIITADSSAEDIAGIVSAAHLVGPEAATNWYKTGQSTTDASGTSATTFYNRGKYSQTQVPIIKASVESSNITSTG
jgi:hypothetical protein